MYKYEDYRSEVFREEYQVEFLQLRDRVKSLLAQAGAVSMNEAIRKTMGLNWRSMAYVDRLVELGEIREITGDDVMAQDRVFVAVRRTA